MYLHRTNLAAAICAVTMLLAGSLLAQSPVPGQGYAAGDPAYPAANPGYPVTNPPNATGEQTFPATPVPAPTVVPMPLPGPPPNPQLGELEQLAVNFARRAVLAHYPGAGLFPMRTAEVMVRPAGDVVHLHARIVWHTNEKLTRKFQSKVYATMVYTPGIRRVFELEYEDNYWVPHTTRNRIPSLVSKFNEELKRRDGLRLPHEPIGPHLDHLAPRSLHWVNNLQAGDRGWHTGIARDRVKKSWIEHLFRPFAP